MIILKTLLLLVFTITPSYADDVLSQIAVHLVKADITLGDFQQEKHLKVLRKPLLSTGTFIYHQQKGVIWQTLSPVPSLLLVNDTKLLTSEGELAVPAAFGQVFKAMLGGDFKQLAEGFSMAGGGQKSAWHLELIPNDALLKKLISAMVLAGDTELRSLEIQEAGGNTTRITFTHISHPTLLPPGQEANFERLSP
ncbi:MAG: outer membrane lipoprotein carrier protein LolA [Methylococcales bacterium]|nr:outer membrane lipoprotein carrier protein LolA [Methylococcales bacterium]